ADIEQSASSRELGISPHGKIALLMGLPLAEILLEAMIQHPNDAPADAIKRLNTHIGPAMQLVQTTASEPVPDAPDGMIVLSHALRCEAREIGALHLLIARDEEESGARHFLAQLSHLLSKATTLRDRNIDLYRLAITDELTGVYNARQF